MRGLWTGGTSVVIIGSREGSPKHWDGTKAGVDACITLVVGDKDPAAAVIFVAAEELHGLIVVG